jgi:hypothetical protein
MMVVPGDGALTESEGTGSTVTVCVAVAESPEPSSAVIVKVCVPTSLGSGAQKKLPAPLMSAAEADESGNESVSWYASAVKPAGTIIKVRRLFAITLCPGESAAIDTEAALATLSGTHKATIPSVLAMQYLVLFIGAV